MGGEVTTYQVRGRCLLGILAGGRNLAAAVNALEMRAWRMRRATRLRPTATPSAANSAWMRGAPYVLWDRLWISTIRSRSSRSARSRAAGRWLSHA